MGNKVAGNYEINIPEGTDSTTAISSISYEIEKMQVDGISNDRISQEIQDAIDEGQFPSNLQYIDSYYDEVYGTSGCAFLDTNTGKVVLGYAGTNWDADKFKDIRTDIGIALGECSDVLSVVGDSTIVPSNLVAAIEFYDQLVAAGYDDIIVTGHSLGGNIAVIVGIHGDVQLIVTYNGAPIYGLPSATSVQLEQRLSRFEGRIIRFVSEEDWLNNMSITFGGTYAGELYVLYNGNGHDLAGFMEDDAQKYISKIFELENEKLRGDIFIDFDGDGTMDLVRLKEQLTVKNLLSSSGSAANGGVKFEISSDSLFNLSHNLFAMATNDYGWIEQATDLCHAKNKTISGRFLDRNEELETVILQGLKEAKLTELIGLTDETFKKLESTKVLYTLETLMNFDGQRVTNQFNEIGTTWYVDGVRWDPSDFIFLVNKLRNASSVLHDNITTTGDLAVVDRYGQKQIFNYDTFSKIAQSFVDVTNSFEPKIRAVFNGEGLREGKEDAISQSLTEVLAVEMTNNKELKTAVHNLGQLALSLAQNFNKMDEWLEESILNGNILTQPTLGTLPETYNAFLEETHIFADVKDVLEAFDLQVEQKSTDLTNLIVSAYEELLVRYKNRCTSIIADLHNLKDAVNLVYDLGGKMVTVTRKTQKITQTYNPILEITEDVYGFEDVHETHGILRGNFPYAAMEAIEDAKFIIIPEIDKMETLLAVATTFLTRLYDLHNLVKHAVENAVYQTFDLDEIVLTQTMIGQLLQRMMEELNNLQNQMLTDNQGAAISDFAARIGAVNKLMDFYQLLIADCFGEKMSQSMPATNHKTKTR